MVHEASIEDEPSMVGEASIKVEPPMVWDIPNPTSCGRNYQYEDVSIPTEEANLAVQEHQCRICATSSRFDQWLQAVYSQYYTRRLQ